jgi:hypothetical protein
MPNPQRTDDEKKAELMAFLRERVFDPILNSPDASVRLKTGVRYTIMRMNKRDPFGMVQYYWSAVQGTDRSIRFADDMREEGFTRFEDPAVLEEFRVRFGDDWLRL